MHTKQRRCSGIEVTKRSTAKPMAYCRKGDRAEGKTRRVKSGGDVDQGSEGLE